MIKILKKLKRFNKLLYARPGFIFSFCYLTSINHEPALAFQRQLFIKSWCNPQLFIYQLYASLRWWGYLLWLQSYKACRRATSKQLEKCGFSRSKLYREYLKYGFLYALSPQQYNQYQLYNNQQKKWLFHFIYNQQLPTFHQYSNQANPRYKEASQLLSNKYRFEQVLAKANIPTIKSNYYKTSDLLLSDIHLFKKKSFFCKPNQANQSQDAFSLIFHPQINSYSIEPIHGENISGPAELNLFLRTIYQRNHSLLIQPMVQNHRALPQSTPSHAAITIRIITGKMQLEEKPVLLYLQLEIANQKKNIGRNTQQQFYKIIPLHWKTLEVDPVFKKKYPDRAKDIQPIPKALKSLLQTSIDYCLQAHAQLIPLRSVAFDVVITADEGPLILEANAGWGISILYQVIESDPLSANNQHPAVQWLREIIYKTAVQRLQR